MRFKNEKTFRSRIYIAGDYAEAKTLCRKYCMTGLCVTLLKCDFVYTGGAESGVEVGLVNYPRFPSTEDEIRKKSVDLACELIRGLCQTSALVVDDVETTWITTREENDEVVK